MMRGYTRLSVGYEGTDRVSDILALPKNLQGNLQGLVQFTSLIIRKSCRFFAPKGGGVHAIHPLSVV